MANIATFPLLNPVRFPVMGYFKDLIPSFYQKCDYSQPYQVNDVIRFQINVNTAIVDIDTMTVQLIKLSDNSVAETFAPDYAWVNGGYINVTVSTVVHSGSGEYFIKITMPPVTGTTTFYAYSEKIYIKSTWSNTVLLEYSNSVIDNEFFTIDHNGGMYPFFIRFAGGFRPEEEAPANESSVFSDQNKSFIALSGEAWTVKKLTVGDNKGIPNYIRDILNRVIFQCNSLYANNVSVCRGDSSAWEQSEKMQNWAKSVWKIDLIETPNNELEVYPYDPVVIDDEIDVISDTFEIGDLTDGNLIIDVAQDATPLVAVVHIIPVIGDEYTELYEIVTVTDQQFSVNVGELPADASFSYDFYYQNI